jgi:hypothetical protein
MTLQVQLSLSLFMQYLMPFVEKEKYELPSKCRLHPENDMFREQEQHKIHFDINEWRCGFCKKSFRAEKFIDQHFANRHNNLVDNVCFLLAVMISSILCHFPRLALQVLILAS